MATTDIGFLHPGQMGVSLAVSAQNGGHRAHWVSAGRSEETRRRAARFALADAATLDRLCELCSVIVSICPPHAAEEVASEVANRSFGGLYLDANAIAPGRATRIGQLLGEAGAEFVDGAVIGGPAWEPGQTRMYLSGPAAETVADYFSAGPLETVVLDDMIGRASALKVCYAAHTKGTTALVCSVLAAAEALQVREALESEWSIDDPEFAARVQERVRRVTRKAWRFEGEMREIADTFEGAGLPGEFHGAAAEIYRRLESYKNQQDLPDLHAVLETLASPSDG